MKKTDYKEAYRTSDFEALKEMVINKECDDNLDAIIELIKNYVNNNIEV